MFILVKNKAISFLGTILVLYSNYRGAIVTDDYNTVPDFKVDEITNTIS